jgi:hypothetical protein
MSSDERWRHFLNGYEHALTELRNLIQSDLDASQTLNVDAPGLRKALLIIERMERDSK